MSMDAPSFCACLTEEFINTVQRDPRSIGVSDSSPSLQNSSIEYPMERAKVSINEPQPEEQASFRKILSIQRKN